MSSTQDFTCIFCSETFDDKESLQEHFRKHGDPKFNSVTKNKNRFANDSSAGSEKSEENEMVRCDVCDEMFKSISKAITHKHKVHPDHDAKHFCPWCGKLFTMKHLYNKHMQSSHNNISMIEENKYHCDCCNVDFFVPSAMVYHNRFFHRQDTELPAIGHSKKVQTCNQELIQIYYCPFCGEEYNNKVNLHKHMADDHNDENQSPDEVLRCPLCDAVFYHLDAYELHLSFHTPDDKYNDDNEMASGITEFSLESVPPTVEKVEEEISTIETEGIDKFLQLVMSDSCEPGNNDGSDKSKSKKHKKHKKSKKAAITLDEFLNMNKDVFGDGLDVEGIEEVPTQQVLKKCKGKKNNIAKAIPVSALAKLKKQGITVKSNSAPKSLILKTNTNVTMNKTSNIVPNRTPVMATDKPKTVTTSNELLSKLLNQGNNQIKIVKKPTSDSLNKDGLYNQPDIQEPTLSNMKQSVSDNDISSQVSNEEGTNASNTLETEQVTSKEQCNVSDKYITNHGDDNSKKVDMEDDSTLPTQEPTTSSNNADSIPMKASNFNGNDHNINKPEASETTPDATDNLQKQQKLADIRVSDNSDTFDNSGENVESNVSDYDDIPSPSEVKYTKKINETFENESLQRHNKSLEALKHLSGHITIKSAYNTEGKSNVKTEADKLNKHHDSDEEDEQLNSIRTLGTNIQGVSLKKPYNPQKKTDNSTKSIDALKTLNKQLTITPCVTSTTKCNDESEDDEPDSLNIDHDLNPSSKTISNEEDNANFKTPMLLTKQLNATAKSNPLLDSKPSTQGNITNASKECIKDEDNTKNTFNLDILKRLTNVTAKPISRVINSPQIISNQHVVSRTSVIRQIEKNKEIDQDIEIFNIDDSDSDQELLDEQSVDKEIINTPTNIDYKTTASANVLKNLSKNITVKPSNLYNKNILNVKTDISGSSSRHISDGDSPSLCNTESKKGSQNKHINSNLNHTLKKLGNNISIKSQHSSPDSRRYQMFDDENIDYNIDMNCEESDSENTNQLKITEMQEDDEDLPSDADIEHNENVIVQSPHASNSENDEEHYSHSDEEGEDDIEKQIKTNTLTKENSASKCLDNFKKNNTELTIKSLNDKNIFLPKTGLLHKKQEEATRMTINNKVGKDMTVKQCRAPERTDDDNEGVTNNVNQTAATSSASQKVSNQVNTVKTVKTFQSETIIEEITTTVTKTIRTVNKSSKQVANSANATAYRPRLMVSNQQAKQLQGMTVRTAPTVGTKIRNAAPMLKPTTALPTKAIGQLVPVRPQTQIVPRQQGILRPSIPGPSNVKKVSPQPIVQKPVVGKRLKISPLALNPKVKRAPDNVTAHFSPLKKIKDSMIPSMDSFDGDGDESAVNYTSTSSCMSDFSTSATKIMKGKSVMTATQTRSEQHSEQHITKLNNMAGLKIVRTNAKQASQVETKNICAAKRTTMDAIEKLQKQGLLVKKPRIEVSEENEHYNSDSEGGEDDYEEND